MHNLPLFSKIYEIAQQQPIVLATVVNAKGASPRKIGAKMFFLEDGSSYGTIGGGCVEGTIKQSAAKMFQSATISQICEVSLLGTPGSCEQDVCGGKMWILLEKITKGQIKAGEKDLTLLVMAAGIGSRYGGTKQIEPIGPSGEILLDYSIADAVQAGFNKLVLIIRPELQEQFEPYIKKWLRNYPLQIQYVYQELSNLPKGFHVPSNRVKPWGTSHAVLCARNVIDSPFAVINADDCYGRETYNIMADFLYKVDPAKPEYSMAAFCLKKTFSENGPVSRGVCYVNSEGYLDRIVEQINIENKNSQIYANGIVQPDISLDMQVSMNFWGFTPTIFAWFEEGLINFLNTQKDLSKGEYYIPLAIDQGLQSKKFTVKVLPTPEQWVGVTYKEDVAIVKQKLHSLQLV